jgi:hypothetical protein
MERSLSELATAIIDLAKAADRTNSNRYGRAISITLKLEKCACGWGYNLNFCQISVLFSFYLLLYHTFIGVSKIKIQIQFALANC